MASTDNIESDRLGREYQMIETNINIDRLDIFHLKNLNVRNLGLGLYQ